MAENFFLLRTNPPSRKPPQGCVQMSYDAVSGTIQVIDEAGTSIPFEGAELGPTLEALSDLTLTSSTILSVNSSGVPVALSYAATKTTLSLNLVDNTSDASKPISTATQAALDLKQPLDATLTALAGQNWAANSVPVGNDIDGVAQLVLGANTVLGRSSAGGVAAKTVTDSAFSALAIAVGSAGGVVVNGGALATPSSGTLSNCSGLPVSTGVSGLGNGIATFLGTPSSANLLAAVTDETGSGALVFGTSPTITTPNLAGASLSGAVTLSANNSHDIGTAGTALRNVYAATGFHVTTGQFYNIIGVGTITGATDGVFQLKNVAGSAGAGSLCLGVATSGSPRIKASGTQLQVRLGDDSAYAPFAAGRSTFTSGENHFVRVVTAAGAVTVATTDYIVVVNKSSGEATTVNLPGSPTTGDIYIIKDGKGDAASNNITVTPAAGNIDGAGTLVMVTNYQSARLVYNGTQWNVI